MSKATELSLSFRNITALASQWDALAKASSRSGWIPPEQLGDVEFLRRIEWDRSADSRLKTASDGEGLKTAMAAISETLVVEEAGAGEASGCGERTLWSKAAHTEEMVLIRLLGQAAGHLTKPLKAKSRPANKASRSLSDHVEPLLAELTGRMSEPSSTEGSLTLLASFELLAFVGGQLLAENVWPLWRHTLTQFIRFRALSTDEEGRAPTTPPDNDLVDFGELPFVAGIVFGGVAGAGDLVKSGRRHLVQALTDNLDGDGSPRGEIVARLPLWLAPLIRATLVARRFGEKLWSDEQRRVLRLAVERAIPLCRPDGKSALSNGMSLEPLPVLMAAAELFELTPVSPEAGYLQSVHRVISGKKPGRVKGDGVMTMPSNQSDWARFALLRSDWSVGADSVAVAHHQKFPQLDVSTSGIPLVHGDWTLELLLGDAKVELAKEWSCVCWQSDPDADYIELQMIGPKKMRLERIIMLSRKEKFLLLADSVSNVASQRIEYRSTLPLAAGITARADVPTREVQLARKGIKVRAFPLALPQDRVMSSPHALNAGDERLTLHQVVQGEGLFAPLLFDWHPDRSRVEAQWRTLTVTEAARVVTPDIATGHRLKLGNHQLLVFRSLKATGESHAVLGLHTRNETVIAKFDKNGDADPILMVEGED